MGLPRIYMTADAVQNRVRPPAVFGEAMLENPAAGPGVAGQYEVGGAWGGNYGIPAGVAIAQGDGAEYDAGLADYRRLWTQVGGFPPAGTQVVVGAGAAGAFAGQDGNVATADGAGNWAFTAPADGQIVETVGQNSETRGMKFIYSATLAAWYASDVMFIPSNNMLFVDPNGNDATGTGTMERPFATPAAAAAGAGAGDTVVINPGVYAGAFVVNADVNFKALVPGTVTIQDTVAGGAVVEVTGPATGPVFDGIDIINLSAAGPADIALLVDNALGGVTGPTIFRNGDLTAGAGVSTALQVIGDGVGAQETVVTLENVTITGTWDLAPVLATDIVTFRNVELVGGVAGVGYAAIAGALGNVIFDDVRMAAAALGETIDYGSGGATGILVTFSNFRFAGILLLNNAAGAGFITMGSGSQIAEIAVGAVNDQIIVVYQGDNTVKVKMFEVDLNAVAGHNVYTVPAGRAAIVHEARLFNWGVASGAGLIYAVNGSGAGTIVAPVGAAALAAGFTNAVVLSEVLAPFAVIELDVTQVSGAADVADIEIEMVLQ